MPIVPHYKIELGSLIYPDVFGSKEPRTGQTRVGVHSEGLGGSHSTAQEFPSSQFNLFRCLWL